MYTQTNMLASKCIHLHMFKHIIIYACTYSCLFVYLYRYIYVHTFIYTCIHTSKHTDSSAYTKTHPNTHTQTHTQTHIHITHRQHRSPAERERIWSSGWQARVAGNFFFSSKVSSSFNSTNWPTNHLVRHLPRSAQYYVNRLPTNHFVKHLQKSAHC